MHHLHEDGRQVEAGMGMCSVRLRLVAKMTTAARLCTMMKVTRRDVSGSVRIQKPDVTPTQSLIAQLPAATLVLFRKPINF